MELKTHSTLYQSGDCKVLCMRAENTRYYYAAKVLDRYKLHTHRKVENEIAFLQMIAGDPYLRDVIPQFRDRITWPGQYGLLTDYVSWPTLAQFIKKPPPFARPLNPVVLGYRLFWILWRLLSVHRIIHRDIKPANLFIDPVTGNLKVCDFGLALVCTDDPDETSNENGGTPLYAAPEVLICERPFLLRKVDTFSAGMVIWEFAAGRHPLETRVKTVPQLMDFYMQHGGFHSDTLPPDTILRALLQRVVTFDFCARPDAADACAMFHVAARTYGVS
jgi:serine/threonine protein kinase